MRTKILSQETFDVVTIEDAMEHSRITDSYDELVVQMCLDSAHDLVQQWLNRKIVPTSMVMGLEQWKSCVHLQYPPVVSITSITAEDSDEVEVTLTDGDDYKFDDVFQTVKLKDTTQDYSNFKIIVDCGYRDGECPEAIKHAIRMTFATLYENREDLVVGTQVNQIPNHARRLVRAHRVRGF